MATLLAHCSLLTLAPGGRARASQLGVANPNTTPVSQALGLEASTRNPTVLAHTTPPSPAPAALAFSGSLSSLSTGFLPYCLIAPMSTVSVAEQRVREERAEEEECKARPGEGVARGSCQSASF